MSATSDSGRREKTAVYVQALRLIQDGQVRQARSRVAEAVAAKDHTPATSAAASEALAAAIVRVITELPTYANLAESSAQPAIRAAHEANRPAWAAAVRAAHACGLIAAAAHEQAIEAIVIAEAELAAELALPGPLDPFGSPSGLAAAANNLGAAYELLSFHSLAEPHLTTALRISAETYGPEIESQVSIDLFNLASMDLLWSLELLARRDTAAAAERARNGAARAHQLRARAAEDDQWPALELAGRALELGAISVADPAAISDQHADAAAAWAAPDLQAGPEIAAVTNLVAARVARLRGRPDQAAAAAAAIAVLADPRLTPALLHARQEAAAAVGPNDEAGALIELALADRLRLRDLLEASVALRVQAAVGQAGHPLG